MNPHINADPAELAKFSELAHRWWDPESEFRPLHQINPLRLGWIEGLVPLAGKHVVDIGCGGGILSDSMARKGANVLGIDLSTKALRVAQLHALETSTANVQYQEISAEALALERPGEFDVVTCMEMLEHVPDPSSVSRPAGRWSNQGVGSFSPPSTAIPSPFCSPSWGRNTFCSCCPKERTSSPSSFVPASWPRIVAAPAWNSRRPVDGIQPADTTLLAQCRYQRELPVGHTPTMTRRIFPGVRAVLFDLDGTLIDSAPDLGAAADSMRLRRGMTSLPQDRYRPLAGSGARGMLHAAFGMTPEHPDYNALKEEFFGIYSECLLQRTLPFHEVQQMLAMLQDRGLSWGVVTNKSQRFTVPITQAMPLFATASAIISGDTTPHAKPHPAPLLEAARRMSLSPSECMYVGDDERDIQAGRAAGMCTVAARYGYLGAGADVAAWGANAEVSSPLELLNLLEVP